jgi:hypothetical protein
MTRLNLLGNEAGEGVAGVDTTRDAGFLERDPEKACPGLDPGWKPVFGKDHAPVKQLDHDPIQLERIMV